MPTTNYGWVTPTVGGSNGAWGTQLNTALEEIDADLRNAENEAEAAATTANAALPKAGGVMTGRADLHSASMKLVEKGSISGAQSLDLSVANYFTATIVDNTTFSFSNVPSGAFSLGFVLEIVNGGASTVTWPASVKWPGGSAPSLTAAGRDILVFISSDDGTTWHGVRVSRDSK